VHKVPSGVTLNKGFDGDLLMVKPVWLSAERTELRGGIIGLLGFAEIARGLIIERDAPLRLSIAFRSPQMSCDATWARC
jgi:hypothetical protein